MKNISDYIEDSDAHPNIKNYLTYFMQKDDVSRVNVNTLPNDVKLWLVNDIDSNFLLEVAFYYERPDLAKLAMRAGHQINLEDLTHYDFCLLVGMEDSMCGEETIIWELSKKIVKFIDFLIKERLPITSNTTLIEALCWTGQYALVRWATRNGFVWSRLSMFKCLVGLCREPIKKYEERLKIIKYGLNQEVPGHEKYRRFTSVQSLLTIKVVDSPYFDLWLMNDVDEIIDAIMDPEAYEEAIDQYLIDNSEEGHAISLYKFYSAEP